MDGETTRSHALLVAALVWFAGCDGPSSSHYPEAPSPAPVESDHDGPETTPAGAWTGDPSVLPDRQALPDDHPLFAALERLASCELSDPSAELDACEHWPAVEAALPAGRTLGDGQSIYDVSLLRVLASPEPSVRQAALLALSGMGGHDYEVERDLANALIAGAESERDPATVALFAGALAEIEASEAGVVDELRTLVTTHPVLEFRVALLDAWGGSVRDPAILELIGELQHDDDPTIRRASLEAVWHLANEDPAICPRWLEAAKDPDPMVEFAALLRVVRFCPAPHFDAALKRLQTRLKAGVVVEGINTILTWAEANATTDKQRARVQALLESLERLGVQKWVDE